MHGTYYIENTLMGFHAHLIRNSCCFDSKLISSVISIERFMVLAGVFLKHLVFWNVALCLFPSIPRHFEVSSWFIILGQGVQEKFPKTRVFNVNFSYNFFFGNTWQVNQVIEKSPHIQDIT
jgi:hypothetical protein